MKTHTTTRRLIVGLALATSLALHTHAGPPTNAITYQGQLTSGNAGANGRFDFRFSLWSGPSGGSIMVLTTNLNVEVTNGLFTTLVDFGGDPTSVGANYLEIAVRTNGFGPFDTLAPRQLLTATPYAFDALHANSALSSVTAAGVLPGSIVSGSIAPSAIVAANVNATSFSNTFWSVTGNPGTTAGPNFLGTTDNQPLELRASNQRALRLEWNGSSPNVIGGATSDVAGIQVHGGFIGGGADNTLLSAGASTVGPVIGGGRQNTIESWAFDSVVGGGMQNRIQYDGDETVIAGGLGNRIGTNADYAAIGGGTLNAIGAVALGAVVAGGANNTNNSTQASISGGRMNFITTNSPGAVIAGGLNNFIWRAADGSVISGGTSNGVDSIYGFVGGGYHNTVVARYGVIAGGAENILNPDYGTIGGGLGNYVGAAATNSVVAGGGFNMIGYQVQNSVIGGGLANYLGDDAGHSVIAGGRNNLIQAAKESVISGGVNNSILDTSWDSVIGGGAQNTNDARTWCSVIAGGWQNRVNLESSFSVVGGGSFNTIGIWSPYAVVAGGRYTAVSSNSSFGVVSGGDNNVIGMNAWAAVIPGGDRNKANATNSLAAGHRAIAQKRGSFVWADTVDFDFDPFAQYGPQGVANSFNVRSTGGFYIVTGVNATNGLIASGAYLAPGGGAWIAYSDRNGKENLQPVNQQEVLAKVAALPMSTWNYRTQDGSIRHLGPMAQDFRAAFSLGETDTGINTVDADGVALAAIQGLNQKLEQQLRAKEAELQALKDRLTAIERRLEERR